MQADRSRPQPVRIAVALLLGACGSTAPDPAPAATPLATWSPECGNAICEIDEATSSCPADCGVRRIAREPFVLHGAPVPDSLADLRAATRLIIRGSALGASPADLARVDANLVEMPHSVIITTVSGAESVLSGFQYCLPTGSDLERWTTLLSRAAERYDGDADTGCLLAAPDCYGAGDGLYPSSEALAHFAARPIHDWQVENEWLWQAQDCSSGGRLAPTPQALADHLAVVSSAIRSADANARIILGALESLRYVAALDHADRYQYVEVGLEDCEYERARPADVDAATAAAIAAQRAEMLEVLRLSIGHFDVLDVHHYGANPYAMLYEAETARSLLQESGAGALPLWSLENAGPFFFFPLLGQEPPATCPPIPRTLEEARATGVVGAYDDGLLAELVAKHYVIGLFAGFERIAWSSLVPTIGWTENFLRTSLLDYDYAQKPAYATYRLLSQELGAAEQVDKPLPEVYRFFLPGGAVRLLVWSDVRAGTMSVADLLGSETVLARSVVPHEGVLAPPRPMDAHVVPVGPRPLLVTGP